jgi:hypothetical protein
MAKNVLDSAGATVAIYTEDTGIGFVPGSIPMVGATPAKASITNPLFVQLSDGGGTNKTSYGPGLASAGQAVTPIFRQAVVSVAPTVTASAYSTGNCLGGLMTFASMLDAALTGTLQSIQVVSKSALTCGLKLYLFNANPTGSTFTDKAAPSIAAADITKLVGVYTLSQADSGLGTHTIWVLDAIGKTVSVASGSTLYALLTVQGTPTPASTSDITATLSVLKD